MDNNASRADDAIAADRHAGQYAAVSAEPVVTSDCDREGVLIKPVSLFAVDGVVCGVEAAARADKHIVAEVDINVLFCADIFPALCMILWMMALRPARSDAPSD